MHRPRSALSALAPAPPVEERERRVALAFIDAACLLGVDGRGEPTEVQFAEDMAVWLLAIDWPSAASLVRERLQHLAAEGEADGLHLVVGEGFWIEWFPCSTWPMVSNQPEQPTERRTF